MPNLPTGTITFLFTDIESSTKLWEDHPIEMRDALARHDELIRAAVQGSQGRVFRHVGDAFCAAFSTARGALDGAVRAQRALAQEPWQVAGGIRVRMALHTDAAEERDGDYIGPPLNRISRLLAIGHGGQILVSHVTEELLRDVLPAETRLEDLGTHRLRDLMRPERVYQVLHPDLPSRFPPLRSLENHPHNLPLQLTPLIGREQALSAVQSMVLAESTRIVTLTGPGGTGKTRLALQAAANLLEHFEDGAYFVDLSGIESPSYIIPAITRTLDIRESGARATIELLRDLTSRKRLLLLLDNVEQIAGAAGQVVEILRACPAVKLMVTSREALHLRGEQVFPVSPLSAPRIREARGMAAAQLRGYDAVSLFLDRAAAVRPGFLATDENAPAIAGICACLDGLPLAIELAAARISLLPPRAILDRLGDRLSLLDGGLADLPQRQRTLGATIEWSYRLLGPAEQVLLREMAVFAGGATLEALEKVCACAEPGSPHVLESLFSLVSKSLLGQEDRSGEPRFTMFESIRQYGLALLEESGEAAAIREAHARYFQQLAEKSEPLLRGPSQKETFDALESEHENFQAALDWFDSAGMAEEELRLCGALGRYWQVRGFLSEGERNIERALRLPAAVPPEVRARVFAAAGNLAGARGLYDRSLECLREALRLCRESGNQADAVRWGLYLAETHRLMGDLPKAREQFLSALSVGPSIDERDAASAAVGLGLIDWQEGRLNDARGQFEQCRQLCGRTGDRMLLAKAVGNLGIIYLQEGRLELAASCYREAKTALEQLGDVNGVVIAYNNLGTLWLQTGDFGQAMGCFEKMAGLVRGFGNDRWLSVAFSGISDSLRGLGDPVKAVEYAERACSTAERVGPSLELGVSLRALGESELARGYAARARECFERCIPLVEQYRDPDDLERARRGHALAVKQLQESQGGKP